MTSTHFSATRAPYTGLREGFEALMRKKEASLSGGAFARDPRPGATSVVRAECRSTFALAPGDGKLGMGVVQALLAALTGAIRALSWDADGETGRVTIDGVGSGGTYQMSWDDHHSDYLLLGGFINGATYQAALVGLARAWAQRTIYPRSTTEVLDRWWTLVAAMDALYPRIDPTAGWDRSQIKAACQDTPQTAAVRAALEGTADALHYVLRYRLPDLVERGLYVQYAPCVSGSAGTFVSAAGSVLLTRPDSLRSTEETPLTPTGGSEERSDKGTLAASDDHDADLGLDLVGDDLPETPPEADAITPVAAPSAASTPAPPATVEVPSVTTAPVIGGASQLRIGRAFARAGDVFLYGVTATGKTMWAKQAAISHGYGMEIVVFKPGVKDEMLYGTSVQDLAGRWVWQDGPIVRAARRAVAGERIVLLLDELPRGDKSVVAGTMDLMNLYSAADLLAQRLPVPAEAGPYRIVRVFDTQETLVFPACHLKIVATANLGDRYQGMDLSDPAFRRRWTGGWLELTSYDAADTASILAGHLGLPATHVLIRAMINVDREVQTLQRKDESLIMTTNLATLIAWGHEVLRVAYATGAPPTGERPNITDTFTVAAQDLWLDMVCPLTGDCRDPEVYRELLSIIQRHAPGVL